MRNAILSMLGSYIAGWISREQFEDWFVPATWDAAKLTDPEVRKLSNRIKLRLAEFLNGDWSEAELKAELANLLPRGSANTVVAATAAVSETCTITVSFGFPRDRPMITVSGVLSTEHLALRQELVSA